MRLKIKSDFAFAHHGHNRREYTAGEVVEVTEKDDPELVTVSVREGWAENADAPEGEKGKKSAPENKARKGAPEDKSKGGE